MKRVRIYIETMIQIVREEMTEPDFDEAIRIMNHDYDMFPSLVDEIVLKLAFKAEFENG